MENIKQLTKEEFEFLEKYEDRLNTAATSAYVRTIPSATVHRMREIYSRLIGQTYAMNENCGGCILTLCRKLNKPYNDYKETIQRNSTGRTTEVDSDTTKAVGGEVETGDSKRTQRKVRSKSSNTK